MRLKILAFALLCAVPAGGAAAETVPLNHLDCYFNEASQAIACPEVLPTGRAAAEPAITKSVSPAEAGGGKPASGTPEWNAYCAEKYNSFDPATGNYRSYSGKTKPCR